ncbi:hypothetical protein G6F57_017170 [Rhizopus arrhizus]|nr:hypothetical protein G6F57_017170 [Rhizopus arrhizus]
MRLQRHVRGLAVAALRVAAGGQDGLDRIHQHRAHHQQEQRGQPGIDVGVDHDLLHLRHRLGRRGDGVAGKRRLELVRLCQEALRRIAVEDLDEAGVGGADQQPHRRNRSDPCVAVTLHLEQHHRAQHQRDAGQHLVGNAAQRPQRLDAPERIDHAGVQQISPQRHAAGGADDVGGPRLGLLQRWHEVAQQVLQHEAPGTGSRSGTSTPS